ncbi:MAG TPA: DUF1028 domain-containing protein [Chloroflexi bacterium]|nr:DUF1028 domain-containing protein [Chloroflexota bacterium]
MVHSQAISAPPIATFSIVAYDPQRQEWGVAVQSKFPAVGAVVSWARAGAGAVATQAYANLTYGPRGLDLMASGLSAADAIRTLTEADDGRSHRQVGMVDAQGRAAAFTGAECTAWAGHIVGEGFACQGNILIPGTVEAMATRFEHVRTGEGELADWLVAALEAGQSAGGDSRGRQSAAVLVVRAGGGYGGNNDRYLDLRVDDHPEPITELQRLLKIHHLYFGPVDPEDALPLAEVAAELQALLSRVGLYNGAITGVFDAATRTALRTLIGRENLEERWDGAGDRIDRVALAYLRERFAAPAS